MKTTKAAKRAAVKQTRRANSIAIKPKPARALAPVKVTSKGQPAEFGGMPAPMLQLPLHGTQEVQITLRLEPGLAHRLDALTAEGAVRQWVRLSRSDVLRAAISAGLASLESLETRAERDKAHPVAAMVKS